MLIVPTFSINLIIQINKLYDSNGQGWINLPLKTKIIKKTKNIAFKTLSIILLTNIKILVL